MVHSTAHASAQVSLAQASNYDTDQIWRDDKAHFVHPFTHFDSFKKDGSLFITEAKGAYIFDSRGRRYLDGIGGLWCMSIGFGAIGMNSGSIANRSRHRTRSRAFDVRELVSAAIVRMSWTSLAVNIATDATGPSDTIARSGTAQ